jgi:hypothetical protein
VDILYSLYCCVHLDIDVRAVLLEQVQVVQDYLAVITDDLLTWCTWLADCKRLAVVTLVILQVVVLTDDCLGCKHFWELFLARQWSVRHFAVHAGHLRVVWPTGTVGHLCKDTLPQLACRIP